MRVIEQNMLNAIHAKQDWFEDNTRVVQLRDQEQAQIFLHGHSIAIYDYIADEVRADKETLRDWPTATTKSRLRALGVNVYTKKHVTYLNDEIV